MSKPSAPWLAVASLAALMLVQPQIAQADYKKVRPDKRSPAQIAKAQASA